MKEKFLQLMETHYRDVPIEQLKARFPQEQELHYALYVHLINAFGYRENWAEPLLKYIAWDKQGHPYFPVAPKTPEAHRHKFLFTLCLSKGSPKAWKIKEGEQTRQVHDIDFVAPILASPLEDWGDYSVYPDTSWTLQFLSAHCDAQGRWQDRDTPLAQVTQDHMTKYLQDYQSKNLYQQGKTLFVESGLHFLEALNQLTHQQSEMILETSRQSTLKNFFPQFKEHLLSRLAESAKTTQTLLQFPNWQESPEKKHWIALAIEQTLVSGHLLEVCFHPAGALLPAWQEKEITWLKAQGEELARLMLHFFEDQTQTLLDEEDRKAYHFPMFHAYHALKLSERI